jgi:hypothetical protein
VCIQTQIGFAMLGVRTVTMKTLVRKYRTNISIEVQFLGRRCGSNQNYSRNKTANAYNRTGW